MKNAILPIRLMLLVLFLAMMAGSRLSAQIMIEFPNGLNGTRDSVEMVSGQFSADISIFPNPGHDQIRVSAPLKMETAPVMFDLLGKRVDLEWRQEEMTWVASTYEMLPGIYLVMTETELGFNIARWQKQ